MKKAILLILIGCIAVTTYGQQSTTEDIGDGLEGTEEPVVSQNDKEEIEKQATLAKEERKRAAR